NTETRSADFSANIARALRSSRRCTTPDRRNTKIPLAFYFSHQCLRLDFSREARVAATVQPLASRKHTSARKSRRTKQGRQNKSGKTAGLFVSGSASTFRASRAHASEVLRLTLAAIKNAA